MATNPDRVEEARGPRPDHRLRLRIPNDWKRSELPDETPDFSNPNAFQALLVCVAPYAPVVVTVAVRPYGEGALKDHAGRLCDPQAPAVRYPRLPRSSAHRSEGTRRSVAQG